MQRKKERKNKVGNDLNARGTDEWSNMKHDKEKNIWNKNGRWEGANKKKIQKDMREERKKEENNWLRATKRKTYRVGSEGKIIDGNIFSHILFSSSILILTKYILEWYSILFYTFPGCKGVLSHRFFKKLKQRDTKFDLHKVTMWCHCWRHTDW